MADRPSFTLCDDTVNAIVARLGLVERTDADGGNALGVCHASARA